MYASVKDLTTIVSKGSLTLSKIDHMNIRVDFQSVLFDIYEIKGINGSSTVVSYLHYSTKRSIVFTLKWNILCHETLPRNHAALGFCQEVPATVAHGNNSSLLVHEIAIAAQLS